VQYYYSSYVAVVVLLACCASCCCGAAAAGGLNSCCFPAGENEERSCHLGFPLVLSAAVSSFSSSVVGYSDLMVVHRTVIIVILWWFKYLWLRIE
jgi:hypothetical protein